MKPFLFETMKEIIGDAKCELIGEIGTHKGGTSKQFIELFAPRVNKLTFYGYDIFDGEVPDLQFHKRERISMFHWKFTELEDGTAWRHMRQYVSS